MAKQFYMKDLENQIDTYYLDINSEQTLQGLQYEFNLHFPFLRIEFIRENIKKGSRDPKNLIITTNENIRKIQSKNKTGRISYNELTTVNKLENSFLNDFGLNVQVFRKSGSIWLVTTSTDDWTLGQQNEEGKSIAFHLKIEEKNVSDPDQQ